MPKGEGFEIQDGKQVAVEEPSGAGEEMLWRLIIQ